jgi:cytoskeletal protein CcmA (bactofilin family)
MWRKEDSKGQEAPEVSAGSVNSTNATRTGSSTPSGVSLPPASAKAAACVSQGIKIKGEVTGSEDLFVDGFVDGKITLGNATLTIGPNAIVKADLSAREVVVRGRVEGKVTGSQRIQVWHSARIQGEMKSERIGIEEGAELHGKMEAGKPTNAPAETASVKKADPTKHKDTASGDDKSSSGAAVAGAD